jgi:hypothetical protein
MGRLWTQSYVLRVFTGFTHLECLMQWTRCLEWRDESYVVYIIVYLQRVVRRGCQAAVR